MTPKPSSSVIEAQRLNGDLVVTFSDNRCGLFPAHMLYEMLSEVEVVEAYEPQNKEFAHLPATAIGTSLTETGD